MKHCNNIISLFFLPKWLRGLWSQRRWSISLEERLTIWSSLVFSKHPSNTTWWPPISIASASDTIIRTPVSGCKLVKLVNGSCQGSEPKRGWTWYSEGSSSSCKRHLNVDGWESWIESSWNWANGNSQSFGFYESMLSTTETKKISNPN
jgi:hypothetical protein